MRRLALPLLGVLLFAGTARAAVELRPMRGLRAEVAALLVQGVPGGSLPLAAALFAGPGAEGGIEFVLEVAPAPADAAPAGSKDAESSYPLELYAYAVDRQGQVAGHFSGVLIDWPASGEGVKVSGRLEVPRGELSVRFLAFDPTARRYGLVTRELLPAAGTGTPRFRESCAGWHPVGGEATPLLGLSARPVLVTGELRSVSLEGAPAGAWQVVISRQRGDATLREEVAATPVTAGVAEFVVPQLEPGIYQLSVTGGEEGWSSAAIETWVIGRLPPGDGGCRRGWRQVLAHAGAVGGVAPVRTVPSAAEDRSVEELAAHYRELLVSYSAAGETVVAASELVEWESQVVAADLDSSRPLYLAELRTARGLAEEDPRCLLPLVALHSEAYLQHHRAGRFPLATHSRRLAAAVAELAADSSAQAEERSLIAVGLTGLARAVEERRSYLEAQRLLERALLLDDGQEATRLLLAVSYDRKGRYTDARQQFEELVATNSAHQEARVRLAILLHRLGDDDSAEPLLRAVVAEQPPAWLLSLAYQALGQALIRAGRSREAAETLELAGRRLPGDQPIQLLRAYALDREGRRQEVQRVLAEMPLAEAGRTARFRYSDEPAAALGLLLETLGQGVIVRLPVLASTLAAGAAGG